MTDPITPDDRAAAAVALDTRADARNRAIRTALQLLVVSIVVDLVPVLIAAIDSADAGDEIDWAQLGRAAIRIVLAALLALVTRYWAPPPAPEQLA